MMCVCLVPWESTAELLGAVSQEGRAVSQAQAEVQCPGLPPAASMCISKQVPSKLQLQPLSAMSQGDKTCPA